MPEAEDEEPGATDELVAALAGGAALIVRAGRRRGRPAARRPGRPRPRPPSPRPRPRPRPEEIAAELAREAAEKAEDETAAADRLIPAGRARPGRVDRRTPRGGGPTRTPHDRSDEPAWRTSRPSSSRSCASGPAPGSWTASAPSTETDGDLEKATAVLRERGLAAAAKKAGRDAREGLVVELHPHRRPGRRPRSRSTARRTSWPATSEFQKLVQDLAVQVAGLRPAVRRRRGDPRRRPRRQAGRAARRRGGRRRSPRTSARRSSTAS